VKHKTDIIVILLLSTVKLVHEVNSIKHPHVLKGHIFISCYRHFIWTEPLL